MRSCKYIIKSQMTHFLFKATTDKERMKWAQKANDIHQTATHHPMAFDEHGRMKLNSEEAKKCPILH